MLDQVMFCSIRNVFHQKFISFLLSIFCTFPVIIYTSFDKKKYKLSLELYKRNLDDLSLKFLIESSYILTNIKALNHNFPFHLKVC